MLCFFGDTGRYQQTLGPSKQNLKKQIGEIELTAEISPEMRNRLVESGKCFLLFKNNYAIVDESAEKTIKLLDSLKCPVDKTFRELIKNKK